MKNRGFLSKLKEDGKLELVDPSEEVYRSYLEKSDGCMKSAKILLDNNLYENSITMSYYAMYNSLTALLFKTGIKCKNHSASILLLKKLFQNNELFKIISISKEERIDKQYYVSSKDKPLTKDSAEDMIKKAEKFFVNIRLFMDSL